MAVLEKGQLVEIDVSRKSKALHGGDVYLGQVENVLPGMEAAFIKIGHARNALLYVGDLFIGEERPARRQHQEPAEAGAEADGAGDQGPHGQQGRTSNILHQYRGTLHGTDAPDQHGGGVPEAAP